MTGLLCAILLVAFAPDPAAAEQAYAEGRFAAARAIWQEVLAGGRYAEGPIHFAIGNCCFREGRHAEARLHYLRAALRMPRDAEVAFNLAMTEGELGIDADAGLSVGAILMRPLERLTIIELIVVSVLGQMSGLLLLVCAGGRRSMRRAAPYLVGAGLLFAFLVLRREFFPAPTQVVFLGGPVSLREADAAGAAVLGEAKNGESAELIDETGAWARVRLRGLEGWVETATFGRVD